MSFLQMRFGRPDVERLSAKRDIKGLIKALGYQESSNVRSGAASALGIYGDAHAVKPLIAALKDSNESVRLSAADALGKLGDARAVEPLITALKDSDVFVRRKAAMALGQLGDTRAVEPLLATLKESDDDYLFPAAYALSQFGDAHAIEPPIAALKENSEDVRLLAAHALGKLGDTRAVEPLGIALDDDSNYVQDAAAEALKKIGGPRAMELIELSKQKGVLSLESLRRAVFQWSGNDFVGPNQVWVDKVRRENKSAIAWFDAQGFVRVPTSAGEEGAAEYCFDMATQAQNSGITQEAWAGFHQALRRYARLQNERMLGLTCFNLGKVYGVRQDWEMARLMFLQSAYLANKTGKEDGYAWALFYLGDTSDKLGNKDLAIQFLSEALPVFQRVSPNDVSGVRTALRRLTESKQ